MDKPILNVPETMYLRDPGDRTSSWSGLVFETNLPRGDTGEQRTLNDLRIPLWLTGSSHCSSIAVFVREMFHNSAGASGTAITQITTFHFKSF